MIKSNKITYHFQGVIWQHQGGWHFMNVPNEIAKEIRDLIGREEEGWGRLKCEVSIQNTKWDTAIWWDTKRGTYLLPLKKEVRLKEMLKIDEVVSVQILL